MHLLLPELPPGLEIKVDGASCFRWCGVLTMAALVLAQLLIELDVVGGENGQEPPAVMFGSVGGDHARATPTAPDAAWCRAARGNAADQRHACTLIAHQAIPEAVALKQGGDRANTIGTPLDTSPPWATRESLLATLRAGIRRFDLDVFAAYGSEAGHSLLIGHPGQVQSALGLARPPTQHTAGEIAAMAEHKLWPPPLTLDELLAWMGTTAAGQQVESITLEPKQDESIPESAFVKMLDNVIRAPGLDSRTTIILRSEEAISSATERLQYHHKHSAVPNTAHILSTPGFALAIRDRRADGSAVSAASSILRQAISAIEQADVKTGPSYHTVMPSAALLRDAPAEASALVTAAHAARVSVLAWTVDDEDSVDALVWLGVDGIVSNAPFALSAYLSRKLSQCQD